MFKRNFRKSIFISLSSLFLLLVVILPVTANVDVSAINLLGIGDKIMVCHQPGSPSQQTINVDEEGLLDHLSHGDYEGSCIPLQETIPYECSLSEVEYETFYISADAWTAQKGTIERPFSSVSAALDYAEKMNLPGVELQVGQGVYPDDFAIISRPTRIVGPGQAETPGSELSLSLFNASAYDLGIQGVIFTSSSYGPAITVSNPLAATALCDVRFEEAIGHAVKQSGGMIQILGGIFNSTSRDPEANTDDHLSGTAIVLTNGVLGYLTNLQVDRSSGSGIYVSGAGTSVEVDGEGTSQSLFKNGTGCLGAVVVKDGAELYGSHLKIDSNKVIGAYVGGSGTSASFPFLTASSTQDSGDTCEFNVPSNVLIGPGAMIDISGTNINPFIISDSFVGVYLLPGDLEITLSNGIIKNNSTGMVDRSSINCDDLAYHEDHILWLDNFTNKDSDIICEFPPPPELICTDGIDNDEDGAIDCADSDCSGSVACSP